MEQKNNGQFQIEIGEDVAEGTYSNMAVISHSSSEFVIDFVRVLLWDYHQRYCHTTLTRCAMLQCRTLKTSRLNYSPIFRRVAA